MEIKIEGLIVAVEVLPVGTKCSLACRHCYQNPIRDAGNQTDSDYDMEAMKSALAKEGCKFSVFGGDALLMPIDDLEELWRWGMERFKRNSIQTSATVVTDRHLELFRKYKVSVGISLDGPGELNDIRWAGSLERTREATVRAFEVLLQLLDDGHPVSVITTLNRGNAGSNRLPILLDWYRHLDSRGLRNVNLHLMEIEDEKIREEWALSEEENAEALLACGELQKELRALRFEPITDMVNLLLGNGKAPCTWNACDPYTSGVIAIDGQGDRINCSRTNKSGVIMRKADRQLFVRPIALYHAPQDKGGCSGCRFFFACRGHCPGEGIDQDWRNKTEHCGTLQRVFWDLEARLASLGFRPISLDKKRLETIEHRLLEGFAAGFNAAASASRTDRAHGDVEHGDHNDIAKPVESHGDHNDNALLH